MPYLEVKSYWYTYDPTNENVHRLPHHGFSGLFYHGEKAGVVYPVDEKGRPFGAGYNIRKPSGWKVEFMPIEYAPAEIFKDIMRV